MSMFSLRKLNQYVNKFFSLTRQHGLIPALKGVFNKIKLVFQDKPVSVNVQNWLNYYQQRSKIKQNYKKDATVSTQPKVSIIILTYNNLLYSQLCLDSVYCNTTYTNFEIIVVDNASTDGTVDWLKGYAERHPNLKLILNSENRGFAAGNNQASREASGEYLIYLNNDTVVT